MAKSVHSVSASKTSSSGFDEKCNFALNFPWSIRGLGMLSSVKRSLASRFSRLRAIFGNSSSFSGNVVIKCAFAPRNLNSRSKLRSCSAIFEVSKLSPFKVNFVSLLSRRESLAFSIYMGGNF